MENILHIVQVVILNYSYNGAYSTDCSSGDAELFIQWIIFYRLFKWRCWIIHIMENILHIVQVKMLNHSYNGEYSTDCSSGNAELFK